MRLKKLHLVNYRLHSESILDFQDSTYIVIRGANMGGKSSLAQALSINVTPSTMGLNVKGDGYVKKIKQGESKAVITTEIQGQHLLRNTVTLNTNTSGRTSVVECLDEPDDNKIINGFKNFLADRKDALLVALNTDHFASLDEEKQKTLLAKLVLPSRYDFPVDKTEATNKFIDAPIDFNGEPFEVITTAYKKTYKERETANRNVKEFVIPDALPIPKGVDSESLNAELKTIRERRTKLQTERDAAVSKANEIEVKRATLTTTRENLLKRRDDEQKKLTAAEAKILSDADIAKLKMVAAKDDELAKLKSTHSGLHSAMMVVNQQIERLKDISENGATCPTCDQDIDAGRIGGLIAELEKESIEADRRLQSIDKEIEAIGDVQGALEAIQSHEKAVKEKADIEAALISIVDTGKKTRAELDGLGEKVNATLPFNDPLAELQAKEDKVNEQLRPVIAAEERAKDIKAKAEQLTKLQARAAILDTLVKYWDKDGIKATLISQYIGGFENKIGSVLDIFGYEASLTMEPFSFDVTTKRDYVGPVKELSRAERQLFYPAFQCAVSIAAGIKMVVVDDMDVYLKETGLRGQMYGILYQLVSNGDLEQVIVIEASVDKTVPPKDKKAPGSRYFFVDDGTVEELR